MLNTINNKFNLNIQEHPYFLVTPSIIPTLTSISDLFLITEIVKLSLKDFFFFDQYQLMLILKLLGISILILFVFKFLKYNNKLRITVVFFNFFFFFLISLKILLYLSFFIQIISFFFCMKCFIQKKNICIKKIKSFLYLNDIILMQFNISSSLTFYFLKYSYNPPIFIFSQGFTIFLSFVTVPCYLSLLLIFLLNDIFYTKKINFYSLFIRIIFFSLLTKYFGFSLILIKLSIDFIEFTFSNFNKIPNLFFLSKLLKIFLSLLTIFEVKVGKLTVKFK
jgi:hypothetical protein